MIESGTNLSQRVLLEGGVVHEVNTGYALQVGASVILIGALKTTHIPMVGCPRLPWRSVYHPVGTTDGKSHTLLGGVRAE